MNVINFNYPNQFMCPICLEVFVSSDRISLIKHQSITNSTSVKCCDKHMEHLFHSHCIEHIQPYICPLDRLTILSTETVTFIDLTNDPDFQMTWTCFGNNNLYYKNYYQMLNLPLPLILIIIKYLNMYATDEYNKTLLYCACQRGNLTVLKLLLRRYGYHDFYNELYNYSKLSKLSPLMALISHNHITPVKFLFKYKQYEYIPNNIILTNLFDFAFDLKRFQILFYLYCYFCVNITGSWDSNLNTIISLYKRLLRQVELDEWGKSLKKLIHHQLTVNIPQISTHIPFIVVDNHNNFVKLKFG